MLPNEERAHWFFLYEAPIVQAIYQAKNQWKRYAICAFSIARHAAWYSK